MSEQKHTELPEIGSIWMDADSGSDYLYKYKGIYNKKPFKNQLHFVRFDFETGEEHEGGLYIGRNRFAEDMVSTDKMKKQPCCGRPTMYPSLSCDDCGFDKWSNSKAEAI